jgi:hypothetical protein
VSHALELYENNNIISGAVIIQIQQLVAEKKNCDKKPGKIRQDNHEAKLSDKSIQRDGASMGGCKYRGLSRGVLPQSSDNCFTT